MVCRLLQPDKKLVSRSAVCASALLQDGDNGSLQQRIAAFEAARDPLNFCSIWLLFIESS